MRECTLHLKSKIKPSGSNLEFKLVNNDTYEASLKPGVEYTIAYQAY